MKGKMVDCIRCIISRFYLFLLSLDLRQKRLPKLTPTSTENSKRQRFNKRRLMAQKPRTVICIGDIHGHISKLENLWSNLKSALDPSEFTSALVIFLGDYCDRGPHTKQVIDFFISLPEKHPDQTHVFLAGNHDFAFAAFLGLLDGSDLKETWKEYMKSEKREGWYRGEGFENMHYQGRRWGGKINAQVDSEYGVVYNGSIYDAGSTFESYGVPHGSSGKNYINVVNFGMFAFIIDL